MISRRSRHSLRLLFPLLAAAAIFVVGGCYYRLTDEASQAVYYTADGPTTRWSLGPGEQVRFTDARTGERVVLLWPKIETISKKDFDQAVAGKR